MLLVALLGAVCGIPTASKKQSGELNRDTACSKYVSLTGNEGGHNKVDNAWCDKNCRAGFCPKESCRCFTDPEPEPDAANAEAALAPVGPTPVAAAPLVAPTAVPVAKALTDCPKFIGLTLTKDTWAPSRHEPGRTKSKVTKVDDQYCEKNCRLGFCPKDKCRCSTDPEEEPDLSDESEAAVTKRMMNDPHASVPEGYEPERGDGSFGESDPPKDD